MEQKTKIGSSLEWVLLGFFRVGLPIKTQWTVGVYAQVSEPCCVVNLKLHCGMAW